MTENQTFIIMFAIVALVMMLINSKLGAGIGKVVTYYSMWLSLGFMVAYTVLAVLAR